MFVRSDRMWYLMWQFGEVNLPQYHLTKQSWLLFWLYSAFYLFWLCVELAYFCLLAAEGRPVSQCELWSARNVLPKVVITRKILLLSFLFFVARMDWLSCQSRRFLISLLIWHRAFCIYASALYFFSTSNVWICRNANNSSSYKFHEKIYYFVVVFTSWEQKDLSDYMRFG